MTHDRRTLDSTLGVASDLANLVEGELEGHPSAEIVGVEMLEDARPGDLTFIGDAKYAKRWSTSEATVALANHDLDLGDWDRDVKAVIRVKDADHAMIAVLERLDQASSSSPPADGVLSPSATVADDVTVGQGTSIGPGAVVGPGCLIGDGVVIGPNVTIDAGVTIGDEVVLHAQVVVRRNCRIGPRSILHAGVVVGSDGFGYRPAPDGSGVRKIPHLGNVVIGADVEIGANSCIDRGKFGATSIGDGTKIDNLCQIGHNVRLGRSVVISGLSGIAGTTTVGDGTLIGGGCGLADHLKIGRGCQIAARSGVMNDIPDGETWGGYPAKEIRQAMKEQAVIRRLPEWSKRLKDMMG